MIAAAILLLAAPADPLAPLADEQDAAVPLATPQRMVRRGETVTLRIARGPLTISTAARALADAPLGGRVRLVVPATRRTLDAIVEGPGIARLSAH